MNQQPSMLVMMSTYNGERYLRDQIDSILIQKDVDVTLFVRDDGSRDQTTSILDAYQAEGKLRWYTGKNLGAAYSFWDLVENGEKQLQDSIDLLDPHYDYYAFADQDDVWDPDKLWCGVRLLENRSISGPVLYYSKKRLVDKNLQPLLQQDWQIRSTSLGANLINAHTSGCTFVMNQSLVRMLRKVHPAFLTMHDSWIARVASAVGTVVYDETPHMSYRQHGDNVVGGNRGARAHWKKRISSFFHGRYSHFRSRLAQQLYDGYADYMSDYNRKMVKAFADAPRSFLARLRLIFSNFPETQKKSEIPIMKLFILFGLI